MPTEFQVSHAEMRQEGLGGHGAPEYFRAELERSWVPGTKVTRYNRTWRLSKPTRDETIWAGHIGFVREGELATLDWDDSTKDFVRGEARSGTVVPFIVDDTNRIVSFQLVPGKVRQTTVTGSLEALLNAEGTTRWKIVPVAFPKDFAEWWSSVARVSRISVRLTYPNPNWTGRSNVEGIMDGLNARVLRITAKPGEDASINMTSPWFDQVLSHVRLGFGKAELTGIDRDSGEATKFVETDKGGAIPAIVKVPTDDEAIEVSTDDLKAAQEDLLETQPDERMTVEDDPDDIEEEHKDDSSQ